MKILIAGAGGQLGRCLMRSLASHDLIGLEHAALDITRLEQVRQAVSQHQPDLVINAAAFNLVDDAERRVHEAYAINALGPRNLAIVTAAAKIPLLHVSTDYVFDGTLGRPYHEFDLTRPLSVYGASKLAGEEAVRVLSRRHYVVRTAWLYWEGGRNFLNTMRVRAANERLRVADDQFGSPTYAPHLAEAITRLIVTEAWGTYHFAGAGGASRWELVREMCRNLGLDEPLPVAASTFATLAARPRYSVLTTIQDPRIELPRWQEGVAEFARGSLEL
ncbi:MAG TPA: dTDP-4-dehydrorhamnose reductase [Candidatus Binataceae bacterium]|nr:dTDP-4-dehydrorhamnose reductase [Candidatus Binataceae bacterium]